MSTADEVFELLSQAIDEADLDDNVEVTDYSGRAMFGQSCVALIGEQDDCLKVLVQAAMINPDLVKENRLLDTAKDNMGFSGVVWYWPHIKVDDGDSSTG